MKAFPISGMSNMTGGQLYEAVYNSGMDLRDYFAAKALNGTIAAVGKEFIAVPDYLDIAKECYKFADAMMEARKK